MRIGRPSRVWLARLVACIVLGAASSVAVALGLTRAVDPRLNLLPATNVLATAAGQRGTAREVSPNPPLGESSSLALPGFSEEAAGLITVEGIDDVEQRRNVVALALSAKEAVEAVRGRRFRKSIRVRMVGKLSEAFVETPSVPQVMESLECLGVAPIAQPALRSEIIDHWIKGAYDPDSGSVLIPRRLQADSDDLFALLVHELTHVLQDQWGELRDRHDSPPGSVRDLDVRFSRACLREGEALLVEELAVGEGAVEFETPDALGNYYYRVRPPFDVDAYGLSYVRTVHEKGGWDAVSDLLRDPPATLDILNNQWWPESVGDARTFIPDLEIQGELYDSAVHGPYYLSLLLREYGCREAEAKRVVGGWIADRYEAHRVESESKEDVIAVLVTKWDTRADAEVFIGAVDSAILRSHGRSSLVSSADSGNYEYRLAGERFPVVTIELIERRFVVLARGTDRALVDKCKGEAVRAISHRHDPIPSQSKTPETKK